MRSIAIIQRVRIVDDGYSLRRQTEATAWRAADEAAACIALPCCALCRGAVVLTACRSSLAARGEAQRLGQSGFDSNRNFPAINQTSFWSLITPQAD